MNFDDRADIYGISMMINENDINSEANLDDIEKQIVSGKFTMGEENKVSVAQQYVMDLDKIVGRHKYGNENFSNQKNATIKSMFSGESYVSRRVDDENSKYDESYYSGEESPHRSQSEYKTTKQYDRDYGLIRTSDQDGFFNHKTREEERANALKQFLKGDDNDQDDKYNIGPERLEDDRIVMIEQIENLKVELEIEGCDVARFDIKENDNYEKIQDVWRKLKLKSQYKTYSNMFEEGILLGAEFIEWAFDGDKEYFGYKPCMVGWGDTVKVKLKRMKLETASFVSGIMQEYKMSAGLSIMTQLLVSGVLYSVIKRKNDENNNEPSGYTTNKEWKDAAIDFDD